MGLISKDCLYGLFFKRVLASTGNLWKHLWLYRNTFNISENATWVKLCFTATLHNLCRRLSV